MKAMTTIPRLISVLLIISFISIPSVSVMNLQVTDNVILAGEEPLRIILMIGDGMGYQHVELARLVEVGEYGSLMMQNSDWNASATTYASDAAITDSAAAGTAMATGHKTNRGYLGVSRTLVDLENIVEYAQSLNKSTGIVSTCRIVDATPASFMTHVESRNDFTEIARQIVEDADVDVLLGGGLNYFSGSQISTMVSNNYSMVYNRTELAAISSGRVFGLFANEFMAYEYDRNYAVQPSIAEMTNKSISLLSQDPDGFFLMVEGGQIDIAAHNEDKVRNALDTIAFDKAVGVAIDYVENHNRALLIVTADHETEGLVVLSHDLGPELPVDLTNENDKRTLRAERVNNITVDWTVNYHTDWNVPVFGHGAAFENMISDVLIDNTDIFNLMKSFYLGNPLNGTEYPHYIPTTPIVSPTETTTPTDTGTSPGTPPDLSLWLAVSLGGAILIVVAIVLIKRR
ncbi:MAG: alkaline phosphatase [Candidatus Thorarchaeota archaeon]